MCLGTSKRGKTLPRFNGGRRGPDSSTCFSCSPGLMFMNNSANPDLFLATISRGRGLRLVQPCNSNPKRESDDAVTKARKLQPHSEDAKRRDVEAHTSDAGNERRATVPIAATAPMPRAIAPSSSFLLLLLLASLLGYFSI